MSDITTLMMAAAGATTPQYKIERSLRFNSADSAYLSRTPASAGSRTTWTWSGWIKRSSISTGSNQTIFIANTSATNLSALQFLSGDTFRFIDFIASTTISNITTTQLFRDVSAWYHIVLAYDTTQATSSNRIKLYINGVQVTAFGTATYPSQNYASGIINNTSAHSISGNPTNPGYINCYMTEINFIDGQALTPSSFGETDATTGVWKPKAYAGTYGTNGFYLDFSDNTSTTTLGYDAAGSNDWTLNNFSVTAGAGNDSLVDTPTPYGTDTGAGGEVRGNYATLNPLAKSTVYGLPTLSNGNLQAVTTTAGKFATATIGVSSGKFYWEITAGANVSAGSTGRPASGFNKPDDHISTAFSWRQNGGTVGLTGSPTFSTYQDGDIIGIALDVDNTQVTFYKNGSVQGTGAYTYTNTDNIVFPGIYSADNNGTYIWNFGQRPFAYTAPSGFKALCTQNIDEGTITTSGTFTGNGSTNGPFVFLNGVPTAMTIDGNAVTFGTHADKLANGFKVRSSSASYNANATSMSYTISTTGAKFKYANAQPNP